MSIPLSPAHPDPTALDCTSSVDTILRRFPVTAGVFNDFGIDLCCGASLSVQEAAAANGVDGAALCSALRDALTF